MTIGLILIEKARRQRLTALRRIRHKRAVAEVAREAEITNIFDLSEPLPVRSNIVAFRSHRAAAAAPVWLAKRFY